MSSTEEKDAERSTDVSIEEFAKIASSITPEHWKFFAAGLPPELKSALSTALSSHRSLTEVGLSHECPDNVEEGLPFLVEQFGHVTNEVSALSKDLTKIEKRITKVENAKPTMAAPQKRVAPTGQQIAKRAPRRRKSSSGKALTSGRHAKGHKRKNSRESNSPRVPGRPAFSTSRSNNPPSKKRPHASSTASRPQATPGKSPSRSGNRNQRKPNTLHTSQSLAHLPLDNEHTRRRVYQFGTRKVNMIVPSDGYPTAKEALDPVEGHLELTHIHGYSGNKEQSRQNLHISPDGTYLLYFIAAVCVVRNLRDGSQRFFREHNDDITTICLDPREGSTLVASGQKDPKDTPGEGKDLPKVWIWDYATMKKRKLIDAVCDRTVLRVQWSSVSGNLFIVCGDDTQALKIFDPSKFRKKRRPEPLFVQTLTKEEIIGLEISPFGCPDLVDEMIVYCKRRFLYSFLQMNGNTIEKTTRSVPIQDVHVDGERAFTCAKFIGARRYIVGGVSGGVYLCHERNCLAYIPIHEKSVGDMIWNGIELITASHDRSIKRFVVNETNLEETYVSRDVSVVGSDFVLSPRAMAFNDGILYIGTKSNQVLRFDMESQEGQVIVDGHDGQVWGLACHPTLPIYVTSGWDRAVKLWDANTLECVATYEFALDLVEFETEERPWRLIATHFSPLGDIIAVGTTDSRVALLSFEPLELLCVYQIPPKTESAELEAVSYMRFNSDATLLGVAHMDALLYIFDVVREDGEVSLRKWPNQLYLQNSALTHLQWSADSRMIKSFTRDYEIMHWRIDPTIKNGMFDPNIPDPDDVKWFDDPIIAGWDVEGLYMHWWDGTDLNDVSKTQDGMLVASGDDYGTVRLHNYPAVNPRIHRKYTGHAEFVVGVEFLHANDEYLITCGGADMSIFQWKLHRTVPPDEIVSA